MIHTLIMITLAGAVALLWFSVVLCVIFGHGPEDD